MENSFGDYLREQREAREISLDQLSAKTRIQKKFLSALEKNQYEQLPGLVFVRGFIRLYAKELGLDPEQTLQKFEEYLRESKPVLSGPKSGPIPQKPRLVPYLLIAGGTLAMIGLVVSLVWSIRQNPTTSTLTPLPSSTPMPKPKPDLETASALSITSPFQVRLTATELCWLLATIDGKESKEAMLYPGERFSIEAQEKLSLLIGNAGGVEIIINDVKLKPIGAHWKPMRLLIPEDLGKYLPEQREKPGPEKTEPKPKESQLQPEESKPKPETTTPFPADKKPE